MRCAIWYAVLFVLAAAVGRATVSATVYVPTELGDLTRASQAIVRAVVVDVAADRSDPRGRISSVVTLEAEAYVKGNLGRQVRIRVPGGRLGRYENIVLGAPRFAAGQRVVLFLGSRPPQLPHLVGLGQGVFRVIAGPDGPHVTPPAVTADTASGGSGSRNGISAMPVPVVRGDAARRSEPLDAFERRVAALAAGGR
jgi:hypothetical protein